MTLCSSHVYFGNELIVYQSPIVDMQFDDSFSLLFLFAVHK